MGMARNADDSALKGGINLREQILIDTDEASRRLAIARNTLAKLRVAGGGPPFIKVGAKVLYPLNELDAWIGLQPLLRKTRERREPALLGRTP